MAEKKKMHPNSLANLQPPFKDGNDPRILKSRSEEANAKRSETARKNYEEKEKAESFQRIVKRINKQKLPASLLSKLDIAEYLTKEELANLSNNELNHLRLQFMAYTEQDPIKMIKILEYNRDTSGEKPVEETVIKETKGQSTVGALLSEIKKMNKKEDD